MEPSEGSAAPAVALPVSEPAVDEEAETAQLVGKPQAPQDASPPPPSKQHSLPPEVSAVLYCCIVLLLGMQVGSYGPAILSLQQQVGAASLAAVAYGASVRTASSLASSFAGPLYDRFPGHVLLCAGVVIGGLGAGLVAACSSVPQLYVCMGALGISAGFADTGANILMIWRFAGSSALRKRGRVWLQALHFAFAAGATLGPLVQGALGPGSGRATLVFAASGAASVCCGLLLCCLQSPEQPPPAAAAASDDVSATTGKAGPVEEGAELPVPARIPASPPTEAALPEVAVEARNASEHSPGAATSPMHVHPSPTRRPASLRCSIATATWLVVVNGAVVFFLYVGAEHSFGTYAAPFGVLRLGMSEAQGQLLTAVYWGSLMTGRFVSIFVSAVCSPALILSVAISGSACVSVAMLAASGQESQALTWALASAFGFLMAPQFPTLIALAQSFFDLRARHTTVFSIASCIGVWLLPFIVAVHLEGPASGAGVSAETGASGVDAASESRGAGSTSAAQDGILTMLYVVCTGCVINCIVFAAFFFNGKGLRDRLAHNTSTRTRVAAASEPLPALAES